MTPTRTPVWDIYEVLVENTEPQFHPWAIRVPATSGEDAIAKASELLDEKREFTLRVRER